MAQSTFSGHGSYKIDVNASLQSQSGLTSRIHWRILVIKTNNYGHSAWGNNGSSGWADSNRSGSNKDLWSNGNIQFNFQNGSNSGSFLISEGTFDVQHNADGTARYFVTGSLTLTMLGSATATTGWRSLPRIRTSTTPPAPDSLGVDTIDQTSMRYRFSSNGNGGSDILQWQIGYGTNPNTTQSLISSNGTSTITGLQPGTTYYFWARGRNVNGWSPWSTRSSGRTIAGARVKLNGVWKEAVPYVKINGVWRIARPYSKINGTWKKSV